MLSVAKNAPAIFQYKISGTRSEKKIKGQGSSERYQKILFKNLFLRFKSKYLCCNVTLPPTFWAKKHYI